MQIGAKSLGGNMYKLKQVYLVFSGFMMIHDGYGIDFFIEQMQEGTIFILTYNVFQEKRR